MRPPHPSGRSYLLLLLGLAGLTGCASWSSAGEPLARIDNARGHRFAVSAGPHRRDDLLLMLSLSGGGTRAAALAHGVLLGLERERISHDGGEHALIDELDLISGVSGGGVVAAHYALDPQRYFASFEREFLRRDLDRDLWKAMLNPFSLLRLASRRYSRGDLYAEVLDRRLFHGATFADFARVRAAPFLILNATDLSVGGSFEFVQDRFDAICSDLDRLPVARAVAASAAAPPFVSPLALRNYAGRCDWRAPTWIAAAANPTAGAFDDVQDDAPGQERLRRLARQLREYQAADRFPWLHLIDGSISDDLGVHALIDGLARADVDESIRSALGGARPRRLALIVVQAYSDAGPRLARRRAAPGELDTVARAAQVSIDLHSSNDAALLRRLIAARARAGLIGDAREVHVIVIDPRRIEDESERRDLVALPATLSLAGRDVSRLIDAGSRLLRSNAEYRRLVGALGGARLTRD